MRRGLAQARHLWLVIEAIAELVHFAGLQIASVIGNELSPAGTWPHCVQQGIRSLGLLQHIRLMRLHNLTNAGGGGRWVRQ